MGQDQKSHTQKRRVHESQDKPKIRCTIWYLNSLCVNIAKQKFLFLHDPPLAGPADCLCLPFTHLPPPLWLNCYPTIIYVIEFYIVFITRNFKFKCLFWLQLIVCNCATSNMFLCNLKEVVVVIIIHNIRIWNCMKNEPIVLLYFGLVSEVLHNLNKSIYYFNSNSLFLRQIFSV